MIRKPLIKKHPIAYDEARMFFTIEPSSTYKQKRRT